ncbi:thioredoxin-like protein [Mycena amicta]|nr:thioredoxin-like protein [Mycena amicta]
MSSSIYMPRDQLVIPPRRLKPQVESAQLEEGEVDNETSEETPASVTQIDNFQDLQKFISESKLKSTVINFGSKSGCPGCHMIKPYWHELSATFHDRVNFIHCNLSETEATDAAQHYKVRAMPTFVFLKGDLEIDRVLGSNKPRLLDGVNRLAGKRRNSGCL